MTLSDRFFANLAALGARRGSDPAIFMNVWCVESGLNPRAMNPSGARGLNQMMPATLVSLGAPAEFENLSAEAQLPWIERLIASGERRNGGPFESASALLPREFLSSDDGPRERAGHDRCREGRGRSARARCVHIQSRTRRGWRWQNHAE